MKKRKISLFDVVLYLVFGLIALITIYPFYNVLIVSLANTLASATYSPYLYPHVFDLTGYKTIMSDTYFYRSLGTTLFVTIVGTTLNMVFSVTAAYVQEKADREKIFSQCDPVHHAVFRRIDSNLSGGKRTWAGQQHLVHDFSKHDKHLLPDYHEELFRQPSGQPGRSGQDRRG